MLLLLKKKSMKIYQFIFLLTLFSLSSCEQVLNNYWERKAEEKYVSPYKGTYVGTYVGADQGVLRIDVSSKDYVEVIRTSSKNDFKESFEGGMTGSSFNNVLSRSSGFMLLGNLNASQQNTYSGTWKMSEGNSGTWILKKE